MITYKVLVVDDELGMRLGTEKSLKKFVFHPDNFKDEINFSIYQAEDGKTALEALQTYPIDILLLDYKLPDSNGLAILSEARKILPGILTIMITAYASLEVAINATKKGGFDFLAKPFTPDELRATIRKAAEMIYLNAKALDLEKEKKRIRFQFISVLAHELKSPLNAVENYLYLINDRVAGVELSAYDDMVKRSLIRIDGMRELIADILDLTRIESGQKKRQITELDLSKIVVETIEEFRLEAAKRNITIIDNSAKNVLIAADSSEMEMIISNLLSNAIKYNRDDGEISFSAVRTDGIIRFVCQDSGIGISEQEQQELFQEFYRVKSPQTREILGTGLGLAIVKKTVELYKGSITVQSELGQGTRFEITLPAGL